MFLCILRLALCTGSVGGQSKKTIKEKKISSITVHEYFVAEGMDKPVIESIERYDENGRLTEIKEFNSRGELKLWEKYAYSEEGDLVETQFFNAKGKLESKEINVYSNGLRIEKQYYNNKNKLLKQKVYEYEYRD